MKASLIIFFALTCQILTGQNVVVEPPEGSCRITGKFIGANGATVHIVAYSDGELMVNEREQDASYSVILQERHYYNLKFIINGVAKYHHIVNIGTRHEVIELDVDFRNLAEHVVMVKPKEMHRGYQYTTYYISPKVGARGKVMRARQKF